MKDAPNTLRVHVVVEMTEASLAAVVENVKQIVGSDAKGVYRVDTADAVGTMVSRFLLEKDFEGYVQKMDHYPDTF